MKPAFRCSMVIRQWRLLLKLADYRRGATLDCLREAIADLGPVSERTVRRDLEALIGAGFSITPGHDEGGPFWKLDDAETVQRLAARRTSHDPEDRPAPETWLPLRSRHAKRRPA
jgi:hypothetical protein